MKKIAKTVFESLIQKVVILLLTLTIFSPLKINAQSKIAFFVVNNLATGYKNTSQIEAERHEWHSTQDGSTAYIDHDNNADSKESATVYITGNGETSFSSNTSQYVIMNYAGNNSVVLAPEDNDDLLNDPVIYLNGGSSFYVNNSVVATCIDGFGECVNGNGARLANSTTEEPEEEPEKSLEIDEAVYPNPFTDQLTIRLDAEEVSSVEFLLLDLQGRQVARQKVDVVSNAITYDGGDLPAGVYIYQVIIDKLVIKDGKVIKE